MGGEAEAAGDVLTGGVIASTVESTTNTPGSTGDSHAHGACRNCGATLTGAYCAVCGQAAHIHRSLGSLGHDILHGVFHFEGKIWRTIPELFLRPGRLTRRYIDGERAKFVSPMALYLFTVFLMFAVLAFTSSTLMSANGESFDSKQLTRGWQSGEIEATDEKIAALREQRQQDDLSPAKLADIDRRIADLQSARKVMQALSEGDLAKLAAIKRDQDARQDNAQKQQQQQAPSGINIDLGLGWPTLQRKLNEGLQLVNDNPALLLYKLKSAGYKFSWALIPLSLPFLWLLFFWRREVHLYDHAIFATYSISFMMLLVILLSISAAVGVPSGVWGSVLAFVPPLHMYKQLRGAYGLSRVGALLRLFLLLISITVVLVLFALLLVLVGVLG
jgi:hypothetical protein